MAETSKRVTTSQKRTTKTAVMTKPEPSVHDRAKEEFEKAIRYASNFAKTANTPIWNVDDQSTKTNPTYTRFTKEQIVSYMQAPAGNEKNLRNASIYMYDASSQYRRLIQYYSLLLRWAYVLAPSDFDSTKVNDKTFRKQYLKAANYLEIMNLQHELQKASMVAFRDGVLYGAVWQTNNSFYIQRINPDICSLTSISDGTWQYSVDVSQIQEKKLPLYPPEFTNMYNEYKKKGGNKWQPVPESISFCLKADETNPNYSIPPWCSALPMLYDLETYKALQETATKINNYKMISMKIDLHDDGTPTVDWELAKQYYQQLCNVLPPYIGATISPMKLEDFNFEKSSGTNDVDTVSRSEEQFWFDTGTSALLHGSNVSNTAGALKLSIKSDEEIAFSLMSQAERLVNRILKAVPGTVHFKIQFLPVTIYNEEEKIKYYKDAASLGVPGSKSAYAATLGLHQSDLPGFDYIERNMIDTDSWTPLKSSYNGATPDSSSSGGRPTESDGEITDAGEQTRDSDANANR